MMEASPMIEIKRYRSILEIDERLWDSLVPGDAFFHRHRFIRGVEEAGVEGSRFWYLLFYRDSKLEGSAVLTALSVALEIFTGRRVQSYILALRKRFPDFFKVGILFCGLPLSIGKHNLFISDPLCSGQILNSLHREMLAICRKEDISYLCLKEFDGSFVRAQAGLSSLGFLCIRSLPYVSMAIRWTDFAEYLGALRHSYRRQIKGVLNKRGWVEPCIEVSDYPPGDDQEHLILSRAGEVCSASRFFELYMEVMARAEFKLETLNLKFFETIFRIVGDELELLSFVKGGRVLGSALLVTGGETLTFLLIGMDYRELKSYDVYFNLVYAVVKLAIERRCARVDLGQTSYYLKQRIGGKCHDLYFFLKSRNAMMQMTFLVFKKVLFSGPAIPAPRAFRSEKKGRPGV